ncbi:MAG: helix-turn-helix domain-containing protein [Treponema sp.]|nr:helix-turn-helix domain-containing protein [Treponema sp.]
MKKKQDISLSQVHEKTSPVLLDAYAMMTVYARATGARTCVTDHNCMPIPETGNEILNGRNICLFCIRHKNHIDVKNFRDLSANPCREMHINAMKESYRFGGSYTYMCPLGFLFWTSPIYINEQFAGALMGSGFLGTERSETLARMYSLGKGAAGEAELEQLLGYFPHMDAKKIKALAELMLLCAQSLSVGSEGCHAVMKRCLKQQTRLSVKIEELKSRYPSGSPRPEYPLEKEKELLNMLVRGDTESARHILDEILATLIFANGDQFRTIQSRATELAILLLRMETSTEFSARSLLDANDLYIKTIQDAATIEDLTDVLYRIVDELSGQISNFQGIHHASALKKAEQYIEENLSRKLSLKEIAEASGFSAPYFSTIFKEEMGENLSSYLNRLRVEKASFMLTDTTISLSKIARSCGFEDQSWFSKIFKHYNGISPGKFRNQEGKRTFRIPAAEFSDECRSMVKQNN